MSSGDLLIECANGKNVESFLQCTSLCDKKVTVFLHRSMNSGKGVISIWRLIDVSEKDILEGLASQEVTKVRIIKIRKYNQTVPEDIPFLPLTHPPCRRASRKATSLVKSNGTLKTLWNALLAAGRDNRPLRAGAPNTALNSGEHMTTLWAVQISFLV